MNNERFFVNKECKYFPCHQVEDESTFNCLFCYCPLHYLGKDCGGNFEILPSGLKSCMNCTYPHNPDNYDGIIDKLKNNPIIFDK